MEPTTPQSAEGQKSTESLNVANVEAPTPVPTAPSQSKVAPVTAPVTPAAGPPTPVTSPTTDAPPVANVAAPAVADDVDVIEKEWVDATEQAVAKTAGDPHAKEEAIENLQVDYLKKRYGKDVKKS